MLRLSPLDNRPIALCKQWFTAGEEAPEGKSLRLRQMRVGSSRALADGMRPVANAYAPEVPLSKTPLPVAGEDPLRRILDFVVLVLLFVGVAVSANRAAPIVDPDLWWHLRTGQWILQHWSIPTQDIFRSSYGMGKPWIVYHWLFETFTSRIFDLWGLTGILAATILMTVACTATLTALLARYATLPRAMLLTAAVNLALMPLHTSQPWLFTILFFTIELYLLLQACERNQPAWLLPLIPLFILWVNIHIQFVYGLGLIGCFALLGSIPVATKWLQPVAREWSLRPVWLWGLLAASFLSTLVNPYGWRMYSIVIQYATDSVPFAVISELRALEFRSFTDWSALLLVCSACFSLGGMRRKSAVFMCLMAISCWFGFRSARDIWFPVIISAVVLASRMRPSQDQGRPFEWVCWATAVPLGMAFALAVPVLTGTSESTLQKVVGENYPDKASAYIQSHALKGPLYNSFNWGGYLIWRLPDLPVTIDGRWPVFRQTSILYGRTNIHEDKQLTRAIDTPMGKNWAEDAELRNAKTILLERDCALASVLRSDSRFRLVYEDQIAAIYEPRETAASSE
jgi:hypothetical protein